MNDEYVDYVYFNFVEINSPKHLSVIYNWVQGNFSMKFSVGVPNVCAVL